MTSVNTNIGAINAAFNMTKNTKAMENAMARLSSGLRVNTAADDSAGVSIAQTMEAQIRGLSQAIRNADDAQNLIDTVEGAQIELVTILQRLRELAVQSSNDTNSDVDRTFIKSEATQMLQEIDRIRNQTEWNGMLVLDGNFDSKSIQVGMNQHDTINVDVADVSSSAIGAYVVTGSGQMNGSASAGTNGLAGNDITVRGYLGTKTLDVAAGNDAKDVVDLINGSSDEYGVTAKAVTHLKFGDVSNDGTVTLKIGQNGSSSSLTTVTGTVTTTDLSNLRDAINAVSGDTGVTASNLDGSNANLLLKDADGNDIVLGDFTHSTTSATADVNAYNFTASGTATGSATNTVLQDTTVLDSVTVSGEIKATSHKFFNIGTTAAEYFGGSNATATTYTGALSTVGNINLGTQSGASQAIDVLDIAINLVNDQRANLGGISNRLDNTISNLSNVVENTKESQSHIQDADFAAETSALTKAQILNQAATSMLAQANASKQTVLALLQN